MAAVFQNPGKRQSDFEVYQTDLRLAEMAEPLGFESVWGVEHHFTDYTMCPDVLTYLAYMAGRTERIQLGSMVVVLPWHEPVRVAEQVIMLDHMSNGRFVLGLGRGLGHSGHGVLRFVNTRVVSTVRKRCPTDPRSPLEGGSLETPK
jgi:alkanesulfonate monooxygenase SsuD/methylene tetrahydromethanopterin reductase-like flavin-dependent oxidoreductase (luciferase family)